MLAFITSVRHPLNSNSYRRVGSLLDATLRSVCRQTDDDYLVFVVHNELPSVSFSSSKVTYVRVGFPAPSDEARPDIDYAAHLLDKGTKFSVGIAEAIRAGANHVMLFDADDYLHRGIAALAKAHRDHPGWYSPQGYVHTAGTRIVQFVPDDYHHKNGSTAVVRSDLTGVPASLDPSATVDEAFAAVAPEDFRVIAEHGKWEERLAQRGFAMEPMPFPSSIWEIGTGENHSRNLVSARHGQSIDAALTTTFGLVPPSRLSSAGAKARIAAHRLLRRVLSR